MIRSQSPTPFKRRLKSTFEKKLILHLFLKKIMKKIYLKNSNVSHTLPFLATCSGIGALALGADSDGTAAPVWDRLLRPRIPQLDRTRRRIDDTAVRAPCSAPRPADMKNAARWRRAPVANITTLPTGGQVALVRAGCLRQTAGPASRARPLLRTRRPSLLLVHLWLALT
jgi:hypothetical protein